MNYKDTASCLFERPVCFKKIQNLPVCPITVRFSFLPYTCFCAILGTLVRMYVQPRMCVERLFFATPCDCSTVRMHFGLYIIVRDILVR